MQKLLISLGMDLSGWRDGVSKAKKDFAGPQKGVGNGLKKIGVGALMIGGAATGLFGLTETVVAQSRVFETLQAKVGAADSAMSALKEDVYDLNSALGLRSVKDASEKMTMVAKLSRKTGDELKQLTYQTGLLGKEFGNEEEQLGAQIAVMRAFKSSVGEAGDVVAFLNKQGGDIKGELLESIKEYSVQFSEAGFSLNQTVAVLKAGLSEGWNVDKAADAFKEGRVRLMGGDKAVVDALDLLGLGNLDEQIKQGALSIPQAMAQIQGELSKLNKTEQFRIAKEIFGNQYEDVGSTAMTAMLEGMNKKMKTTGSMDLLTASMEGRFSHKWDKSISKLSNSFSRLINAIKPLLVPIIEWFGDITDRISVFSKKYQYIMKTIAIGIGVFTGLAAVLGIVSIVAGVAGAAFAILTSPITLIIIGVAALAAGLIYLEKKTGLVSRAWNGLSEIAAAAWEKIEPGFLKIKDLAISVWDEIKALAGAISGLFPELEGLGVALDFEAIGKAFGQVFELLILTPIQNVLSVFRGLLKVVRSVIGLFKNGFNDADLNLLIEGIIDIFIKPIKNFFETGHNSLSQ